MGAAAHRRSWPVPRGLGTIGVVALVACGSAVSVSFGAPLASARARTSLAHSRASAKPATMPATSSELTPNGLAVAPTGDVFISDYAHRVVDRVTPSGTLSVAAGIPGQQGAPTPGAATASTLSNPAGLAVAGGNLYITDFGTNDVVEQVGLTSGTLSVVAGQVGQNGPPVPGPATASYLFDPSAVARSGTGTLYIADALNCVVEKVTSSGTLSVAAGVSDTCGYPKSTVPATQSGLYYPSGLAEATGTLYIADSGNRVVEKLTATSGHVVIVAGIADELGPPTPGTATHSKLGIPSGLAVANGALYIATGPNEVVEKVTLTSDALSILAGIPDQKGTPTPGPATSSHLDQPSAVAVASTGSVYVGDYGNNVVEKITPAGTLSVFAGTGTAPPQGATAPGAPTGLRLDGQTATSASLAWTAPASNGGTAITHYLVYVTGALNTTVGTTTTATLTGIGAGSHQVTVKAENGVGLSVASAGLSVDLTAASSGYYEVAADGGVFAFGNAAFHGSMGGRPLDAPVVGMAVDPVTGGYWEVASDGGVFAFGSASFHGSMGGKPLDSPVVGMAAAPTGQGYWEVAADGGVFAFGSASFHGSMGGKPLDAPVVGMAAAPTGKGYWLVARDGGVFGFGSAAFYGSEGGKPLDAPIAGVATDGKGNGYWLVGADGGIFSFGGMRFFGSAAGRALDAPVVGVASAVAGSGYLEVASDGGVFAFGGAGFYGSMVGRPLDAPVVGVAAS